jgi:hypothetical protein
MQIGGALNIPAIDPTGMYQGQPDITPPLAAPVTPPMASPMQAAQPVQPQADWKSMLMKALQNPGLQGMMAKTGAAMLQNTNNPMKYIGAATGSVADLMQYMNAAKKLGINSSGIPGSSATKTGSALGDLMSDPDAALKNGALGFQQSPSTSGEDVNGGLTLSDVIGLPMETVKELYKTAYDQKQNEFKNALEVIKTGSQLDLNKSLGEQYKSTAEHQRVVTEKEKKIMDNWNAFREDIDSGKLAPEAFGLTKDEWKFVRAVDPAHGEDLVKAILTARSKGRELHFEVGGNHIYAFDKVTGQKVMQEPIEKDNKNDPVRNSVLQGAAEGQLLARVKYLVDSRVDSQPNKYAAIKQALLDMETHPESISVKLPSLLASAYKIGDRDLIDKIRTIQSIYQAAISKGLHPSLVEPDVDRYLYENRTPLFMGDNTKVPTSPESVSKAITSFNPNPKGYDIFLPDNPVLRDAIAKAESGGNNGAINADANTGAVAIGKYQILSTHIPKLIKAGVIRTGNDLLNPIYNERAAEYLRQEAKSRGGTGLEPWKASQSKWGRFTVQEVK